MSSKVKFEFAHVGVNAQTPEEGARMKDFFTDVMGYDNYRETPVAFFTSDNKMELMKILGRGTIGHLGFFVEDMDAAIDYLEELGYEMDYETARYGEDKQIHFVFLKEEINGFRLHISLKEPPYYVEP